MLSDNFSPLGLALHSLLCFLYGLMFNCLVTAKLQRGIALWYEGLVMKPIRRREFVRLTAATAMAAAIFPARVLALADSPKR